MARVTPTEAAEKLIRRLQGATQDIARGVARVTEAPGIAAAAAQDLMLQRIIESIQSGRWAEAVSAVSLSDWKTAMTDKGIPRISQGIQAAQPQLVNFYSKLLPALEQISAEVNQMPKGDIEASIARSAHVQRRLHDLKGSFK